MANRLAEVEHPVATCPPQWLPVILADTPWPSTHHHRRLFDNDALKKAVDEWNRGQSGGCNPAVWKRYHKYDMTCGECAALVTLKVSEDYQEGPRTCEAICSQQGLACVEGWEASRDSDSGGWHERNSCSQKNGENRIAEACNKRLGYGVSKGRWGGKAICNCTLLVNQTDAEIKYGHINTWNTTGVTNMHSLFESKVGFDENISNWDTSRVTDMKRMFFVCSRACPCLPSFHS